MNLIMWWYSPTMQMELAAVRVNQKLILPALDIQTSMKFECFLEGLHQVLCVSFHWISEWISEINEIWLVSELISRNTRNLLKFPKWIRNLELLHQIKHVSQTLVVITQPHHAGNKTEDVWVDLSQALAFWKNEMIKSQQLLIDVMLTHLYWRRIECSCHTTPSRTRTATSILSSGKSCPTRQPTDEVVDGRRRWASQICSFRWRDLC